MESSYKQLLNEWARNTSCLHEMDDNQRQQLQHLLLEIYKDVADVCSQYGLSMIMVGGSCLGAVRHKGFIPWDDDLDVAMPRKDYNRFIDLLQQGILSDKYEFRTPQGEKESSCYFTKLYRKGTELREIGDENSPYPKSVFFDIFPIEYVPMSSFKQSIIGFMSNCIRFIGNCVGEYAYRSQEYEDSIANYPELVSMHKKRIFVGWLFSFASHKKWVRLYDKIVSNDNKTSLMGIPSGRALYKGEILPTKVFLPISYGRFEDVTVGLPANPDAYLQNLYGKNYMQVPPPEKRESHFIKSLKINI